nr:immunoglobulin light chain junction region [Macaca mulatta]
ADYCAIWHSSACWVF